MYLVLEDESENISAPRKGLNNMKWWEASSPTRVSVANRDNISCYVVCMSFFFFVIVACDCSLYSVQGIKISPVSFMPKIKSGWKHFLDLLRSLPHTHTQSQRSRSVFCFFPGKILLA